MPRGNRIFGSFKRQKLLRKTIPASETGVGIAVVVALLVAGAWVLAQRNNFDPSERDVTIETLEADSVPDTLYKAPLKRWGESAGAAAATINIAPFPASFANDSWKPDGRVDHFTDETVYEKINGQAEQYRRYGFVALDFLSLKGDERHVDIYLYDQGTLANALGVYAEQRGDKAVQEIGTLLYTPTSVGAYGVSGQRFFQIISGGAEPAPKDKIESMLEELARGDEFAPPAAFLVMRKGLELPIDRIAYVPINVFQFAFARDFWFGQTDKGGDARVFFHQAADDGAAAELFNKIHAEQSEEFEVVKKTETSALYKHEFLNTYFALQVDGRTVYGADGHTEAMNAQSWTQRLGDAVLATSQGAPTQ